jgi:hypothetical protein
MAFGPIREHTMTTTPAVYDFAAIRVREPAALAGTVISETPADGDAAILALFDRWIVERRAAAAIVADEAAWDAQLGRADAIEDEIAAIPASGAAGLAIKFYLGLSLENGSKADYAGVESTTTELELGALLDAVRFAPVLEPLCRDYLAAVEAAEAAEDDRAAEKTAGTELPIPA